MSEDMWERLRLDPGSRTLGQLIQERQWATEEIVRLRNELARAKGLAGRAASRAPGNAIMPSASAASPIQLIRAKELRRMLGISNTTLWRMTKDGVLPRPIHLGERTPAWRLVDIEAWQQGLGR